MRVVIAAARTGGHINPGIAIANKIKQEQPNSEILFIGTIEGLENDLVPRAGYPLKTIEAYGFNRKISLKNIRNMGKTMHSKKDARQILKEFQPDIVIGTGGYICMPVILAAKSLKIPTALHESNAFPGAAVKVLSRKVNEVFVGFEDTKNRLPYAKKVMVTGTPTQIHAMHFTEEEKRIKKQELGLQEHLPLVLVFGGSQGAKSINESIMTILHEGKNENYQMVWAAGPAQYDIIRERLLDWNLDIQHIKNAKIMPYIYNMEEMMNLCDVVISRSGAMTITEVAKLGKAGIFIPLPFATENHQEYNARVLESKGAAKIILDKDLNAETLSEQLRFILEEPGRAEEMGRKANQIEVTQVEEKIYQEILQILK